MSSDFRTTYRNIAADKDVPFTMSDGTTLYADIYRPNVQGRFPALLNRVPYNKVAAQAYTYAHPIWYARHGYVVVVQDTRGRWRSEGEFDPFRHDANDGFETASWVAGLPFCDGRVGLYGYSYCGMNQLLTAARRPPSLHAIAPAFAGSDLYEGW
ncbi:MAG: CocE/NonD family hydrolase, partial [Anaerolineae bacterium]